MIYYKIWTTHSISSFIRSYVIITVVGSGYLLLSVELPLEHLPFLFQVELQHQQTILLGLLLFS